MSIFAIALLSICGLFFNAHAHICLYSPPQRGAQPTFQVGDDNCYQRTGPCGGRPQGIPSAIYQVGQESVVYFQQNFNHFSPDKPGHIDLSISYDNDTTFQVLASRSDYPGFNMNTQTNLTLRFTPTQTSNGQRATLRLRYVSYNPDEIDPQNNTDADFFSCADVIISDNVNRKQKNIQPKPVVVENAEIKGAPGCVTPPRWIATGETLHSEWGVSVKHRIWYDTVAGWIKWERTSDVTAFNLTDLWNLTKTTQYGSFIYALNTNFAGSCEQIYADQFYPWQYGPQVGMYLIRNSTDYQTYALRDVYGNTDLRIQWYVKVPKCLPSATIVEGATTAFEAKEVDSIDPSVFTIPAACKSNTVKRIRCSKRP